MEKGQIYKVVAVWSPFTLVSLKLKISKLLRTLIEPCNSKVTIHEDKKLKLTGIKLIGSRPTGPQWSTIAGIPLGSGQMPRRCSDYRGACSLINGSFVPDGRRQTAAEQVHWPRLDSIADRPEKKEEEKKLISCD